MKWIRRFERFRIASGLASRDEEVHINTLIYAMGDKADDILHSFSLSEEDRKHYATVKGKFDSHFVQRRNVIVERAKFNRRRQEEGEPVETFIYSLAEHCGYGNLHNEMIRDRIVVGIRNSALSEKLQLDPRLTLDGAITQVRQSEAIKQQQPLLRGKPNTPVGVVQKGRGGPRGSRPKPQKQPLEVCSRALPTTKPSTQPEIRSATSATSVATTKQCAGQWQRSGVSKRALTSPRVLS